MAVKPSFRRARDVHPSSSSVEVVPPEELASKTVSLALRYWETQRGTRRFPSREDIVPREMVQFLRNVVLLRVVDDAKDYEYRVAGDAFVEAFGIDFKGMRLSAIEAIDPDYGNATRAVYEYVRNVGEPFALRGWIAPSTPSRFSYHETVFLPIGTSDTVDHLLVATAFMSRATDEPSKIEYGAVLPDSWRKSANA